MAIPTGVKAPDFTLKEKRADGLHDVNLGSFAGKQPVVLLFFPSVFTSVCTEEMCDRSGGIADAEALNAVVYGVSTDSAYAQEGWAKAVGIKTPMLSDYKHEVVRAYDVEWPDFNGMGPCAGRAAFVIGSDGLIKHVEHCATLGEIPDFEKIKEALQGA